MMLLIIFSLLGRRNSSLVFSSDFHLVFFAVHSLATTKAKVRPGHEGKARHGYGQKEVCWFERKQTQFQRWPSAASSLPPPPPTTFITLPSAHLFSFRLHVFSLLRFFSQLSSGRHFFHLASSRLDFYFSRNLRLLHFDYNYYYNYNCTITVAVTVTITITWFLSLRPCIIQLQQQQWQHQQRDYATQLMIGGGWQHVPSDIRAIMYAIFGAPLPVWPDSNISNKLSSFEKGTKRRLGCGAFEKVNNQNKYKWRL